MRNSTSFISNASWSPVTGCVKFSPGCDNCTAEVMAKKLQAKGVSEYRNGFTPTFHEHKLYEPFIWKKPRRILVAPHSDLFQEAFSWEVIRRVFLSMSMCKRHEFIVLTKHAERLAELAPKLWLDGNVWIGVSVEDQDAVERIELLKKVPVLLKFVAFEPLMGPITDVDLRGIDWVVLGGETGKEARVMKDDWAYGVRDAALALDIPLYFNGWDSSKAKERGKLLDGQLFEELPCVGTTHASQGSLDMDSHIRSIQEVGHVQSNAN